tara:strand:- start:116 stop:469 length:354 start_codon:yes stop_codon:yes gene_type:complete
MKLKNYWSEHNLASIDLNVLRESKILTPDNTLDPMFLIALEFSTKFGAIDSNIAKTKPLFKEILSLGVSLVLEKLNCTNEDNHIDYINAVLALVERQSASGSMNKSFVNENSFSFYG